MTSAQTRELLLGNGFSIAANAKFAYRSLFEEAELSDTLRAIFQELGTTDFEAVLRHLDQALAEAPCEKQEEIARNRDSVRDTLVETVAKIHPKHRMIMDEDRYTACRAFLSHFIGRKRPRGGRVFTTNYDLLLYWAIIPETEHHPQSRTLRCEDGFMSIFDEGKIQNIDIIYLHGCLSYFDTPRGVTKIRFRDGLRYGEQMISQIRLNLDLGYYPVFVSEGTSLKKASRISRLDYLRNMDRRFRSACRQKDAALFTVGHSLGEADAHITDTIGRGRIRRVFLGVHGPRGSLSWQHAQGVVDRWSALRLETDHRTPLEAYSFDTSSIAIWR